MELNMKMNFTTIVSAGELVQHLDEAGWVIIDSRFRLANPNQGRIDYETAHIPGAVYTHLDEDLSGVIVRGVTGRHPLPQVENITKVFSKLGIDSSVQVVAYDDMGGALAAGRIWWLLRWLGHQAVAVLDGGWQQWMNKGFSVRNGNETRQEREFIPHPRNDLIFTTEQVDALRKNPHYRLLDVRSEDRFRGENEIIDPVPGHIPGAVSAAYADNLIPDGTFRDAKSLHERYLKLLGEVTTDKVVCYCGSGVTATHNIIAMMIAGLGEARLYAGSYSEWITDPKHPIEK
jgi:thiosulfate/3-mercaptopyruvate sulfurtransferase